MPSPQKSLLTIGELSERTAVPPATLRSWELRYGFPQPIRLARGHRRYTQADVGAVLDVLQHRGSGLALDAAIRRATARSVRAPSIYAELRRRHPSLTPQLLTKSSLVAMSWAIEDECCARAERPLLFGGFQRETFLRESYARWVELARTAVAAVVFADFEGAPRQPGPGTPIEVALPPEAPMNREWIVVCDAPDLHACMAAIERPGQESASGARRRFEMVWTVDPRVVRDASRIAAALADEYRPGWRPAQLTMLDDDPPGASPDLGLASDLLNRMIGYHDASHARA